MRGDVAYPIYRGHKFLLKLISALARCTRNIGRLIIFRLPVEVFQFHAETTQGAVRMTLCKTVAHRGSGKNARCTVELVLPATRRTTIGPRAVRDIVRVHALSTPKSLNLIVRWIDVFIAHAGSIVAESVGIQPRGDIEAQVAAEIEPLRVCLGPAWCHHKRGDDKHQEWRKVFLHRLLLFSGFFKSKKAGLSINL